MDKNSVMQLIIVLLSCCILILWNRGGYEGDDDKVLDLLSDWTGYECPRNFTLHKLQTSDGAFMAIQTQVGHHDRVHLRSCERIEVSPDDGEKPKIDTAIKLNFTQSRLVHSACADLEYNRKPLLVTSQKRQAEQIREQKISER